MTNRSILSFIAILGVVASLAAQETPNPNARFGMPSPAKADAANREDYLVSRPQYVLSYNAKTRTPNWVSWSLRKADIGKAKRGAFEPDPLLPAGFAKVTTNVYTSSGFDRGHMCPAQDRSSKQSDMDATFFLTNVVPQSPASNQLAWERLETYCRGLTKDHVLHICCGPHGVGGEGKDGRKDEIGKGPLTVKVPAKLWKVILVLPSEDAEPRRNTRAIAVVMPNDQSVGNDWTAYRVSVREVEKLTGYTFLKDVPAEVAAEIKRFQKRKHHEEHHRRTEASRQGIALHQRKRSRAASFQCWSWRD
jgi:endonuclease G